MEWGCLVVPLGVVEGLFGGGRVEPEGVGVCLLMWGDVPIPHLDGRS